MALMQKIYQHLIEKFARENLGLENSLWLEKETDKKGKSLSLNCK